MKALILQGVAIVLLIGGFIFYWLPIPLGIVSMLAGLALLTSSNPRFSASFQRFRREHPKLNYWLQNGTERLPSSLLDVLQQSDPDRTDQNER